LILVAMTALVAASWDSLMERFASSDLEEEARTDGFENRGQYFGLAKAILQERRHGVGLNNWSYWVSKRYGEFTGTIYEDYDDIPKAMLDSPVIYDWAGKYAPPAHNLGVITVGEMGWLGVGALGLLWARWLWLAGTFLWRKSPAPARRLGIGIFFGMVGVFLQSLTEWVFRQTAVLFTFYVFAGTLASLYYLRRREWAYTESIEAEGAGSLEPAHAPAARG
jgi:hypothetical protein